LHYRRYPASGSHKQVILSLVLSFAPCEASTAARGGPRDTPFPASVARVTGVGGPLGFALLVIVRARRADAQADRGCSHIVSRATTNDRSTRRTQAERTAATRAKLLDATIACLAEVGYTATTGREVAARAGVSRGAQTHHFPRRLDLIISALDEIAQRRLRLWSEGVEKLPPGPSRVKRALDLLWEEVDSPLWTAAVKLWIAADDDPELYARMIEIEKTITRGFRAHARELFRDYAGTEGFERRLGVALSAVRGLGLLNRFQPVDHQRGDPWPNHRRELERLLTG
jgi:AcrR family transcriptional regulator